MIIEMNHILRAAIIKAEKETGNRCYVVGGYVRNILLNRTSPDIDFVVVGDSIEFAGVCAGYLGNRKVLSFPRFKTARINYKEISAEFVSARSEKYHPDSRKPEISESTLEEDLKRRDFTINSLAARVTENTESELIDCFGGVADLGKKILRTPIDPVETYSDDPLRMFRCVRFAAQLGFRIEKNSFSAISSNLHRIGILSPERISEEFFKIMSSDNPVKGIWLMYRSGLLGEVFPELIELKGIEERNGSGHKDIFIHTLKVLYNISRMTQKKELRIAALMHDIGKPQVKYYKKNQGWSFHGHDDRGAEIFETIANRLKWSNSIRNYVSKMIRLHHRPISLTRDEVSDSGVRRLLFEGGSEVDDLMTLCRADITTANKNKLARYLENYDRLKEKIISVEEKDRLRNFKPPVNGGEIMKLFDLTEGPAVGRIKNALLEAVLSGNIENNRESAVAFLEKMRKTEADKL